MLQHFNFTEVRILFYAVANSRCCDGEGNRCIIGVLSNRQPGRLPGDFDKRYAWVQILTPECQEQVQMKLKIQMKHLESIQMKLKIQVEPIESIQMKLKILGNFSEFLLIVRLLLIKCFQVN